VRAVAGRAGLRPLGGSSARGAMSVVQQLITMAELQDALNVNVHPQWRAQGHAYYRAIWVECAELLDHFGWKWWKHQRTDLDQVKLEIVDIWHFGLSQLIRDERIDATRVDTDVLTAFDAVRAAGGDFHAAVEALAERTLATRAFPIDAFCELMATLPMDLDELFRIYVGKNVLNNFRQAHGYKSGNYAKVWQGREDNEHLFELVGTLDTRSSGFSNELYRALEARYAASNRA
jgi:dimeric dUTPase (all-alpha-NTP-PPase superfamily)